MQFVDTVFILQEICTGDLNVVIVYFILYFMLSSVCLLSFFYVGLLLCLCSVLKLYVLRQPVKYRTTDGNKRLAKSGATVFSSLVNDQCRCTLTF